MASDQGPEAFGRPGLAPRWTRGNKEGLGTAYNTASRVWFTLSRGILNEVYFPTIDSPQVRDLQFLFTDGRSFFHEEKRDLKTTQTLLDDRALGYRIVNEDPRGRYRIVKEIIADPHLPCVLIHARLDGEPEFLKSLRAYVLLAPHLEDRGWNNNAVRVRASGRDLLVAYRDQVQVALGASTPFARTSCGFVGESDGWTDLHNDLRMDWEFDRALDGNVALMGELDLAASKEFTVGLSFGFGRHGAIAVLLQSLGARFDEQRERFLEQWRRAFAAAAPLEAASGDGGRLYRMSNCLLLAHEDKTYPGAMIASLSIPWGDSHGDDDGQGGYHLVWTRDMCGSASALLASGHKRTPQKALIYLAAAQNESGGFYQNFWIDGEPFWRGVQLDEAAFPILLAWRMDACGALDQFDPYPLVLGAAGYLAAQGPVTPQERWEENGGYSPSTLAACIAALVCAADFARRRGDGATAAFLEDYADFLESRVEAWTVTTQGSLVPGIARHYIRLLPADPRNPIFSADPNTATLSLKNVEPGKPRQYPARDVVDGGFLELARYGIRKAGTPLMEDSLRVVDAALKRDTPSGPAWLRYNHDGYGQRADGSPYAGWGVGRPWPLLTGERGHYELAAGRDARPYLRALEAFSRACGLLPEQIWDAPDIPARQLFAGRPTGSAMPLMWAHAEYIKLLRSIKDGAVFDRIPIVADRYLPGKGRKDLEIWTRARRVERAAGGMTLRVQDARPFKLHWSFDDWETTLDGEASPTALGVYYRDVAIPRGRRAPLKFTFYWPEEKRWEGADYAVDAGKEVACS